MKKCVPVICAALLLSLLCSCNVPSGKIKNFQPEQSFSSHVTISGTKTEFEADLTCSGTDDISLKFTAPEMLEGFNVRLNENEYMIDAYGIENCIKPDDIDSGSVLNTFMKSLQLMIYSGKASFSRTDVCIKAEVNSGGISAMAAFDETGRITSLSVPSKNLSADFYY